MENGHDANLSDKLSALSLRDAGSPNGNDSLFQVIKAVEAAEATIKQQVEENNRLRSELQKKMDELEKYKFDESIGRSLHSAGDQDDRLKDLRYTSAASDPAPTSLQSNSSADEATKTSNGTLHMLAATQSPFDSAARSQLSSPSTTSFSPTRYQLDGEYDQRINLPKNVLMPISGANNSDSVWKKDIALKIREHEEEILQLRKQLAEYSVKEAQIRNEKYVLEKRIAYMRLAFDQQQQDLVDAASKALSYRQDIIEENIRLTYALQAAQQERATFVSSLLPLLAEYRLQPAVPDAQSIVSNVKVLFKHLQEKLILTESKLKESQYQLAPWRSDAGHSNLATTSPSHPVSVSLATTGRNGLELVPQATYPHGNRPMTSDANPITEWEPLGHHQGGLDGNAAKNLETDDLGRYSPFASRGSATQDIPAQVSVKGSEAHATRYGEESKNKQVTFCDPVSNNEIDDPDGEGNPHDREPSANWHAGNSPYTSTPDDPSSSYSPYLPPVLEEPSSSFSEAADDDPLPAIEGLQISGEAYPGKELQACGYSINGTTSCNFEWVRHLEDGSVNYIDGAKQPNYLVTADDVDTYLAIEVQPLDNRKRKGELVKVFANEHRKITCDPEMQSNIEKILYSGHASFKVSLSTGYFDIWEPATLTIKREGYSVKCSGPSGAVIAEKFSPNTTVAVPYGHATEFTIVANGAEHVLRADGSSIDVSCSRDTIVLTLRLFIIKAGERRKGKKKGLFFNK